MSIPKLGFELKKIRVPLTSILPVRQISPQAKGVRRFAAILASIKEVGLVEPLMVYPQKGRAGHYLIMDGHLRYFALKELKETEVDCIVTLEDESFTFNARISRVAPIQEHKMIVKAVQQGVPPERIASALNRNVTTVKSFLSLLVGVNEEAADLLKDKPIAPLAIRALKRVKGVRQIEIAELMISMNDFTSTYVQALVMGTPKDMLVNPERPKRSRGLTPEAVARLENEMNTLERDFKAVEKTYGVNVLNLTLCRNYLKKLLDNPKVGKFLKTRYQDLHAAFDDIVAAETL